MYTINRAKMQEFMAFDRELDQVPLEDLDFSVYGISSEQQKALISEWKFIGLSNYYLLRELELASANPNGVQLYIEDLLNFNIPEDDAKDDHVIG